MRGILVCVREYQHMCPHTAMYVCRYGIALYTHGRTQPSGRGSNLVHMHHTTRADTGEGFAGQTRDTKSGGWGGGGGGGGAVRFRPFIHPCTVYLLNGEGDLALGRGTVNPPTPLCVEYGTLSRSGTSCYF